MNLSIRTYNTKNGNYIHYSAEAYNDNHELIGDFIIECMYRGHYNYGFNTGNTMNMSIMVKNEYQGLGISRIMIKSLCEYIENIIPFEIRTDQMIFIDADASNGFWDYIGMKENRYYDRYKISREGCGYEKVITWNKLKKWASSAQGRISDKSYFIIKSQNTTTI